jgi:hypothetical protein
VVSLVAEIDGEVPRKDKRGIDLISDVLPFGRLWYAGPNAVSNAIGYPQFYSRSHPCCDSRLRSRWQRDRKARAQGRFQRVVMPSVQSAAPVVSQKRKEKSRLFLTNLSKIEARPGNYIFEKAH